MIEKYVKENEIERPQDMVIRSAVNKSGKKVSIIQNIDKKINLEDISRSQGVSKEELINEIEGMVYSGTKLNLKYYLNSIMDEDIQKDIFEYFKGSESDSLDLAFKEFDGEFSKEELQLMRIQVISELAN